jgi:hypothetical protein
MFTSESSSQARKKGDAGNLLSGINFYRPQAREFMETKKTTLLL